MAIFGFSATAVLIFIIPSVQGVGLAMVLMGLPASTSDLTMPISWNTCVEIGKQYTATVSSTMNMLGNFAGFVAPAVFGLILQNTGNNWSCGDVHHGGGGGGLRRLLVLPRARRRALNSFQEGLHT